MVTMMGIKKKWNKLCGVFPNNALVSNNLSDLYVTSRAAATYWYLFFLQTDLLDSTDPATTTQVGRVSSADIQPLSCSLCLLPSSISISSLVTIDGYNEQYSLSMDDSYDGGKLFHCQCMDFWMKAVERDLAAIP